MALSEFELIERYFTHPAPGAVLGVGDDAALVRARRGRTLAVSADMLVEGRHFRAKSDPRQLGHKALAVNLSDMAAMGASPRWALLSLALPRVDSRWIGEFMRGFMRLARRHGVDLIGGDTTRGPLNISVQIIGEVPTGQALRRDGARAGDDVWVSGTLGDAALALAAAQKKITLQPAERRQLERRLHAPAPRVALGAALRRIAHSAIDVSDGLVADLGHICERSRLSATVHAALLPAGPAMQRRHGHPAAREAALGGGDDYELVFTASPQRRPAIARLSKRLRLRLTRIGAMARRRGRGAPVEVLDAAGRPLAVKKAGYEHFNAADRRR